MADLNADIPVIEQEICVTCGFCCDGTLFKYAVLQSGERGNLPAKQRSSTVMRAMVSFCSSLHLFLRNIHYLHAKTGRYLWGLPVYVVEKLCEGYDYPRQRHTDRCQRETAQKRDF